MILDLIEDDLITTDEFLSSDILQSKYEPSNIQQIAQGQKQLTPSQRNLDPTVPSVASRAYAVPERHKRIFEQELNSLVQEGVLEPGTRSAWIAGNFHHTQEGWTCPLGIQFSRS
jgi:hypothetical protein